MIEWSRQERISICTWQHCTLLPGATVVGCSGAAVVGCSGAAVVGCSGAAVVGCSGAAVLGCSGAAVVGTTVNNRKIMPLRVNLVASLFLVGRAHWFAWIRQ